MVVFKYPADPQENQTAPNYIKRAWGFGGETVGIYRGDLFTNRSLGETYPTDLKDENGEPVYPRPTDDKDLWKPRYTYNTASSPANNPLATELFEKSLKAGFPAGAEGFEIVRKPDEQLLASSGSCGTTTTSRRTWQGPLPDRWAAGPGWKADDQDEPRGLHARRGRPRLAPLPAPRGRPTAAWTPARCSSRRSSATSSGTTPARR